VAFDANIGAGFKPGGFSAFTGNAALAPFGPERTVAIESDVAWQSKDNALQAVARIFYYAITGYQIERSFATSAVADDYLVVNAPRAVSKGGEIELSWQPVTGLMVACNLGFTAVTLREFRDPYTGRTYDGKRAPYVPVYDASLHVSYHRPSSWFGDVDVSSNGRTFYTEAEDLGFAQKSYLLLDGRFGYARGRWVVALYAHNLTNETYYSAITPGTGHGTPGAPRTYGTEIRFTF
jgi:outer membrane receptor protein involved in Fe transport